MKARLRRSRRFLKDGDEQKRVNPDGWRQKRVQAADYVLPLSEKNPESRRLFPSRSPWTVACKDFMRSKPEIPKILSCGSHE